MLTVLLFAHSFGLLLYVFTDLFSFAHFREVVSFLLKEGEEIANIGHPFFFFIFACTGPLFARVSEMKWNRL